MTIPTPAMAELDASGFREGGRTVRRSLDDIGSGVRSGMEALDAYNRCMKTTDLVRQRLAAQVSRR